MRRAGSIRWAIPTPAPAPTSTDRVAIDWGVYGVPETFVIDRQGPSPSSRSARSRRKF